MIILDLLISDLFRQNTACKHTKIPADTDFGYCPDCGEAVENRWYLSRCGCCGVKLKSVIRSGEVIPEEKFCANCGTKHYAVEKLEKINFIDINFAVIVKTTVSNHARNITQCWTDVTETSCCKPKLLQEFR